MPGPHGASGLLADPWATAGWDTQGGLALCPVPPAQQQGQGSARQLSLRHCSCSPETPCDSSSGAVGTPEVSPGGQGALTEPLISDLSGICGVEIGMGHLSTQMSLLTSAASKQGGKR